MVEIATVNTLLLIYIPQYLVILSLYGPMYVYCVMHSFKQSDFIPSWFYSNKTFSLLNFNVIDCMHLFPFLFKLACLILSYFRNNSTPEIQSHNFVHPPWTFWLIPGVPKKSGTLNFSYFEIRKYSIFWFHQIKHCLRKRMMPRYDLVR